MYYSKHIHDMCKHPDFHGGFFGPMLRRFTVSTMLGAFGAGMFMLLLKSPNPSSEFMMASVVGGAFSAVWFSVFTLHARAVKRDFCKVAHLSIEPEELEQEIITVESISDKKKKQALDLIKKEAMGVDVIPTKKYQRILDGAAIPH